MNITIGEPINVLIKYISKEQLLIHKDAVIKK